jgi:hypothetical protein
MKDTSCGMTKQSPIDLPETLPEDKVILSKWDQFNKIYNNPENVEVKWTGDHTSVVAFPTKDTLNTF